MKNNVEIYMLLFFCVSSSKVRKYVGGWNRLCNEIIDVLLKGFVKKGETLTHHQLIKGFRVNFDLNKKQ